MNLQWFNSQSSNYNLKAFFTKEGVGEPPQGLALALGHARPGSRFRTPNDRSVFPRVFKPSFFVSGLRFKAMVAGRFMAVKKAWWWTRLGGAWRVVARVMEV